MIKPTKSSNHWVYYNGKWHDGNSPMVNASIHSIWMGSAVFDGIRYFDNCIPDLLNHCNRSIRSAKLLNLKPSITAEEIAEKCWEGIELTGGNIDLYIKILFIATDGLIEPEPESTQMILDLFDVPMPAIDSSFTAIKSSYTKPVPSSAPTGAKACCLYPNVSLSLAEARKHNAHAGVLFDPAGNVAEFSVANLFMVKNNEIYTPVPNNCFLNGLTRQRVIKIARDNNIPIHEKTITYNELFTADELFSTGNYAKLQSCAKLDDKSFQIAGPMFTKLHKLYMEYAKNCTK